MKPFSFVALLALLCWHCQNNTNAPLSALVENPTPVRLQTHQEAADTLLADSTAPRKPLIFKTLKEDEARQVLTTNDLGKVLVVDYPDNGFYGNDRYRIEFVFTDCQRDPQNPLLYHVKGKNRYKKTISTFAGTLKVDKVQSFTDPNIDTSEINIGRTYALAGTFELNEDSTLLTSGRFRGTFALDFGEVKQRDADTPPIDLWYYSDETPTHGSGYRFDGTWASYQPKPGSTPKPVIWSRDLFRFANDILKDFSYGERDVEINPKYRNLGWDNFWDGEEWWHEPVKEKAK